jgi:NAD binding domain of 6-phosphogluconate dehydrogenase
MCLTPSHVTGSARSSRGPRNSRQTKVGDPISFAAMPSAQIKPNITFIGLSGMGMLMARRLIDSGWTVNGYDINSATTAALEYTGGTASASPALAAANASITILMVARAEYYVCALRTQDWHCSRTD